MKTTIEITGQIGSISKLQSVIQTADSEEKRINSFPNSPVHVIYPTREAAIQALQDAHDRLKQDDPEDPNLSYVSGIMLSYDAGTARILNN